MGGAAEDAPGSLGRMDEMKFMRSALVFVVTILVCSTLWAGAPPGQYSLVADGGVVKDNKSGLLWQRGCSDGGMSRMEADAYCRALSIAGLGPGWRVPTKFELETLVSDDAVSPSIDRTAFPDTPAEVFWTSTPSMGGADNIWAVLFSTGGSSSGGAASAYWVRCVR